VASYLPDFARNAHGNLSRTKSHGRSTKRGRHHASLKAVLAKASTSAPATNVATAPPSKATDGKTDNKAVMALLSKNVCTACHGIDKKIVGSRL
jgi:cytochrome c